MICELAGTVMTIIVRLGLSFVPARKCLSCPRGRERCRLLCSPSAHLRLDGQQQYGTLLVAIQRTSAPSVLRSSGPR